MDYVTKLREGEMGCCEGRQEGERERENGVSQEILHSAQPKEAFPIPISFHVDIRGACFIWTEHGHG